MKYLSRARSYISLGLFKKSSYVSSHIPWNQCFSYMPTEASLKPSCVSVLGLSSIHCYSSRSKTAKSKLSSAVSAPDKDKDAFFVVRKGDIVGIFKDLSDCHPQVGSSVYDLPVNVYKGYLLPKDTEEYLNIVGMKKPLYSFRASDLKEDMFGALTPCLFHEPTSCKVKVSKEEDTPVMKSLDKTKTKDKKTDQLLSASMSVDPLEKLAKLKPSADTSDETCIVEFDGASKGNPGLSGAAAVLKTEDGSFICKMRQGLGIATNNAAEYHGLILGLKHAIERGYRKIKVKGDSKLVSMQMKGQWKVNHEVLSKLYKEAKQLSDQCVSFEISQVQRNLNSDADELANMAARLSEGEVEVA
ncbi:hypothetical protein CARUB_v10026668mg [Capsella rubella]|uniref:RNase H type-1 domain-containing protein n=1 Tax=Capsella rubella TaxID=81985 RepID=R0GR09_9BRAS|nr:uncharacterized protein LOC17875447 [Capsella rubella]EOA13603.1 hypothetical protein CARUB_v10026668mg [Capsella rubella]